MQAIVRTRRAIPPRVATERPGWLSLAVNAGLLIGLLVVVVTLPTSSVAWQSGQVAGETVVGQHRVTYVDRAATQERQQLAARSVSNVTRFNPRLAILRHQQAATFLAATAQLESSGKKPLPVQTRIVQLLPAGVSGSSLQSFLSLNPSQLKVVRNQTLPLLSQAEAWQFTAGQMQITLLALLSTVPSRVPLIERTAVGELLTAFLTPTKVPDQSATSRRRHAAIAAVRPVMATLYPGQVIVRRGDLVTPTIIGELKALGLQHDEITWQGIAGSLLFASVVVLLLLWYLRVFFPAIVASPRLLLLFDVSILLAVAATRLVAGTHVLLPFFLPLAAASTFAAVLVAPEACLALALAVALLAGWVVANSFELTVYYFVTATAGILTVRRVHRLQQFVVAGLVISFFALVTTLAFGLVDRSYDFPAFQDYTLAAAFNGFVSASLALGGFAVLSSYFGVTTLLQLLELGHPNQPLLRRLTMRAPGTYNHSLVVANMVERAAEEIGANALEAKIAALYHDVGKTANPHCFVENQMGMANVHDDLRPQESARIIRGHISQGLRLAHQYKLPRIIRDGIAEHHGTMTLSFFLYKALHEASGEPVETSLYVYPGPKPQSKETALLMLADGCESAVRAGPNHSAESIDDVVSAIFAERVQQGQLDESPLTLSDLQRTRAAFSAVLTALYHPRIEYPSEPLEAPLTPDSLPAQLVRD